MSKLNKDILFLLFDDLQDDSKSLFSCLMVNRLWCETIIPILWRNPWRYNINCYKKNSLYYIFTHYLTDDIKEFLTMQGIQLPQISCKSLLFDYLSLCKSINVDIINSVVPSGSSEYSEFLLEQEFYNVLIRKCPELKYLDMRSIKHQIFYFPEAKVRLNSLCELKCDTSINPSFFYGLAYICQNIQRFIVINMDPKDNNGITKLIEVQKNLKYFEWKDNFDDADFFDDFYEGFFLALAKKADTLNYLIIDFQYIDDYEHIFLENVLPELHKLKTLKIDYHYLYNEEKLKKLVYHDLEVFSMDCITMDTVVCIVENSGGHLKEILLKYHYYCDLIEEVDNSLILIRKIYENCPLIEYLSLAFPPSKEHFIEFKKLLKACQNLKSLLLIISSVEAQENLYKNGEKLLEILIEFAPTNLKEIRLLDDFKFSLEALETFLEKWKGRPAISILTSDPVYNGEDYKNLINKYKIKGVIKDFRNDNRGNIYYF